MTFLSNRCYNTKIYILRKTIEKSYYREDISKMATTILHTLSRHGSIVNKNSPIMI